MDDKVFTVEAFSLDKLSAAGKLAALVWPEFAEIFLKEIRNYFELPDVFWPDAFIVHDDETVVGFAQLVTSSLSHQACELCWVMTHPDYRGHGIARQVVAACLEKASARQQTLFFATFKTRLFEQLGLQPAGEWRPGRFYYIVQPAG